MEIFSLDKNSLEELTPFITKQKYLPFSEYDIKLNLIANNVVQDLSRILSKDGLVFSAKIHGRVVGIVSLEKLEWDSDHFGIQSAKIAHLIASGNYFESLLIAQKMISHILTECYRKKVLHVSVRVYKEDMPTIHALESKSFRLMDVLVTYCYNFQKQSIDGIYPHVSVRHFVQDEISELSDIAADCFSRAPVATDRFHADPALSKEKSSELYVKWIVDCCKDPSKAVLVAEIDRKPVGFNICEVDEPVAQQLGLRLGTIELTAVRPEARKKQVATSLLAASLRWFASRVDFVESGGQVSNYAMQRAWAKTGFKIIRAQCTFHCNPPPPL
jgi:hypothetical protein